MADTLVPLRDNGTFPPVVVEAIQDVLAATLQAGAGATVVYDDTTGKITVSATSGGSGGATDPELVRDIIAAALQAGSLLTIVPNDSGDTITLAVDQVALQAALSDSIAQAITGKLDRPTGGTDGQALLKSGTGTVWGTVSGSGSTSLTPSGDATGATDLALINNALAAGKADLTGVFTVNGPVLLPSKSTLILRDAEIRLAPFSNCVLLRNTHQDATGDTGIRVLGIGRARLRSVIGAVITSAAAAGDTTLALGEPIPAGAYRVGTNAASDPVTVTACTQTAPYTATLAAGLANAQPVGRGIFNQIRAGGDIRTGMGVFWVNAHDVVVQDVTIGPTAAFTALQQASTEVRWTNIEMAQNDCLTNQDGIDVGPGCRNITIEGSTGHTGDDLCSIYAQNTSPSIHPYVKTLTAADRDIVGVTIRDIDANIGINPLRLQAGDGSKLSKVRAFNIVNRAGGSWPVIDFGPTGYVDVAPAAGDLSDIVLDGYVGGAKYVLALDTPGIRGVVARNIKIHGDWTAIIGFINANGASPGATDIVVEGVVADNTTGGGALIALPSGTYSNVTVRNALLRRAGAFLANGATITGLLIENVKAIVMAGVPFRSTISETGAVTNARVDTYSAGLQRYAGAASKLRFNGDVPEVIPGDVAPLATRGSQLVAASGVDLTGGTTTASAQYVGDGTGWNRTLTFANTATAPDTTAPTVPATPTATAGATSASATTTGSTDNVAVSGYRWRRNGTTLVTGQTGTTVTETGLPAGTAVFYTVSAFDAAGNESAQSTASNSVTPTASTDTTAPSVPATPVAAAGANSATATTSGSTDNVAVTGYRWWRNNTTLVAGQTGLTMTDAAQPAGTAVFYTVSAVDAAGNESQRSVASNSVTPTAASNFAADTFTATDGTALAGRSADTGGAWVSDTNAMTISGNRVWNAQTGASRHRLPVVPAADHTVLADVTFVTVPTGAVYNAPVARASTSGGGYQMRYLQSVGGFRLDRLSGGSTAASIGTVFAFTPTAGQTVVDCGVRVTGSLIEGIVNGQVVASGTDSTTTAAGNVGIYASGLASATTGVHLDNLRAF